MVAPRTQSSGRYGPGMRSRAGHSARLVTELVRYAVSNRLWWLLLLVPFMALGALLVGTAEVAVPYTVYTLF